MTREDFFEALDKLFEGASMEDIRKALKNMEDDWIDDYWEEKKRNVTSVRCPKCHQEVKLSECKLVEEEANVFVGMMYFNKYYCPHCGHQCHETSSFAT